MLTKLERRVIRLTNYGFIYMPPWPFKWSIANSACYWVLPLTKKKNIAQWLYPLFIYMPLQLILCSVIIYLINQFSQKNLIGYTAATLIQHVVMLIESTAAFGFFLLSVMYIQESTQITNSLARLKHQLSLGKFLQIRLHVVIII